MKLQISAQTDIGQKRSHNEDSFGVSADNQLVIVCDGMGGHNAGEVASNVAVKTIMETFPRINKTITDQLFKNQSDIDFDARRMITAFWLANQKIFSMANEETQHKGMGTTAVAAFFTNNRLYAAHIGDSRLYRFREGRLEQLTRDHSWLNELMEEKQMNQAEAEGLARKNIITRALGIEEKPKVDLLMDQINQNDIYLLCSDGLSGPLPDQVIQDIFRSSRSMQMAVERLIKQANANGGPDNITAIIVKVDKVSAENKVEFVYKTIPYSEVKSNELATLLNERSTMTRQQDPPRRKGKIGLIISSALLILSAWIIFNYFKSNMTVPESEPKSLPVASDSSATIPVSESQLAAAGKKMVYFVSPENKWLFELAMVYVDDMFIGRLDSLQGQLPLSPGLHHIELRWSANKLAWSVKMGEQDVLLDIDSKLQELDTRR